MGENFRKHAGFGIIRDAQVENWRTRINQVRENDKMLVNVSSLRVGFALQEFHSDEVKGFIGDYLYWPIFME